MRMVVDAIRGLLAVDHLETPKNWAAPIDGNSSSGCLVKTKIPFEVGEIDGRHPPAMGPVAYLTDHATGPELKGGGFIPTRPRPTVSRGPPDVGPPYRLSPDALAIPLPSRPPFCKTPG